MSPAKRQRGEVSPCKGERPPRSSTGAAAALKSPPPTNPNQQTSEAERQAHRLRNGILSASALLALLLSIAPEVPNLRGVLGTVTGAAPGWLLLAVLFELASCLGYVAILGLVLREGPARQVRWLA